MTRVIRAIGNTINKTIDNAIDRIAAKLSIWALRRLFGGNCPTDVRADWHDDPDIYCLSCDAKRLIKTMKDMLS